MGYSSSENVYQQQLVYNLPGTRAMFTLASTAVAPSQSPLRCAPPPTPLSSSNVPFMLPASPVGQQQHYYGMVLNTPIDRDTSESPSDQCYYPSM